MLKSVFAIVLSVSAAVAAELPRQAPELAINMPAGPEVKLSSFKGKVVCLAFVFTTCSHCQAASGVLSQIQKDYAARGVQVVESAFDPDAKAQVAQFAQTYVKGFPVGWNDKNTVLEFLQQSQMVPYYVPVLVYIDRKGVIRSQYTGDEEGPRKDETIRATLDGLLKEQAKPAVKRKTVTTSALRK